MKRLNFLQILFLFLLNTSSASVFIGPEDEFEIKKIELYALKTNTNTDTSTYPISQRMLANTLSNYREIYQLVTFHEKLNSFLNQENEFKSEIKINLFSDLHPVRNISDDWKDKNSLSLKFGFYNKNFATQLNIHKSNKSFDDSSYYFDDSYISYTKWNMVFGFGALNRWWGPTHNNNLILSNFARPSPGIFFNSLEGFEFRGLFSFLGKANYSFFINRLETNREISNPYLVGTRVTIMPFKSLQVGFSRTLTIGGDNRRENGDIFIKAFFGALEGADNEVGSFGESELSSLDDYSNQLAAIDIKYDLPINEKLLTFYIQQGAEDGGLDWYQPLSNFTHTVGAELKYEIDGMLRSYIFEISKTDSVWHGNPVSGRRFNVIYEHNIYGGYRYRGIPIAAFIDNDSIYTQFSYSEEINDRDLLTIDIFYGDLNKDGSGNSVWGNSANIIRGLKAKYKRNIYNNLEAELKILITDENLNFINRVIDKNVIGASLSYKF
jgi:hypothetical protein